MKTDAPTSRRTAVAWHAGPADFIYIAAIAVLAGFAASVSPVMALVAVFGVAALALFLARVDLFVLFMALYTPFEEFVLKWLPEGAYAPARYAGEGLMAVVLVWVLFRSYLKTGRVWKPSPIDLPMAVFFVAVFLSSVVNDVPAFIAVLGMKNIVRYVLLFYIAYNAELGERFWKMLVYCLLAVAVLESVLAVSQFAVKGEFLKLFRPADVEVAGETVRQADTLSGKVMGTLGRYNVLGNFLNICLCLALGLYYSRTGRKAAGYLLLFGAILAGTAVSFSRMSWLGAYLAFLFILLMQKKKRFIIYMIAPVLATLVLVAAYKGTYWYKGETGKASAVERYVSIFSEGYIEKSMRFDRLFALFVTAPAVLEDYPLLGLGPGTFANEVTGGGTSARGLYPEYSHAYWLGIRKSEALQYTSDQGWVSILCQVGLVGLCAFLWALYRVFRAALAVYRRAGPPFTRGMMLGFLGLVALVAFQNFVSFNLTFRAVSLYFWLFAGAACSFNERALRAAGQAEKAPQTG